METLKPNKKNLRIFSISMFIALTIIGTILLLRHKENYIWFYSAGTSLILAGIFAPGILKPIFLIWTKITLTLAWINTRLILMIIFYLVFTPIGLAIRLFGVDLLDRKIDKFKDSYWKQKEKKEFKPLDYERQF